MSVLFRMKFNLLVITKSGSRRNIRMCFIYHIYFVLSQNYVKQRSCIYYVLTIIFIICFANVSINAICHEELMRNEVCEFVNCIFTLFKLKKKLFTSDLIR